MIAVHQHPDNFQLTFDNGYTVSVSLTHGTPHAAEVARWHDSGPISDMHMYVTADEIAGYLHETSKL